MKFTVTNINHESDVFSFAVKDNGQIQMAVIFKNGKEIDTMKFKKDEDISIDLKTIIENDIKNRKYS